MTKEEQNQIIKDAWVRNLRKENDIPEDIGGLYVNWVRNMIAQASAQLQQSQGPQEQGQEGQLQEAKQ